MLGALSAAEPDCGGQAHRGGAAFAAAAEGPEPMALHAAPWPAALGLRLPPRRSTCEPSLTEATRPLLRCDYSRWGEGTIALEGARSGARAACTIITALHG